MLTFLYKTNLLAKNNALVYLFVFKTVTYKKLLWEGLNYIVEVRHSLRDE